MGLHALLAALLLITNALSVLSQTSDPKCLTPKQRNGFCVPIERCRNIFNIVSDPTNTPSRGIQNYIKMAACTLPGVMRSVCCLPVEISPAPIITIRPTTNPTNTTNATTTNTTTTAAPPVIPPPRLIGIEPSLGAKLNWSLLPTEDCGIITNTRIPGGNKTAPFEYPWMVLLMYQSTPDNTLMHMCGGSLINYRYVLTAAHCLKKTNNFKLVKVRLGEHDKNTQFDCIIYNDGEDDCADPAFDVDIEETIVHQNYNRPIRLRHDIGLIRMAVEVKRSYSVNPICLPVDESVRKNLPTKFIITGWGITEKEQPSDVLLQASVKNEPIPECQQKMNDLNLFVKLEEPWQMCAMGDNKADSCQGDSGGPIGFRRNVSGSPKFVQFGVDCVSVQMCDMGSMPGIYTSVSAYMDWIVANMRP